MGERENEFVRHVATMAPVFTAPPGEGKEFARPAGWQKSPIEDVSAKLRLTPAGYAFMAVMGGPVAVVDVDTKNGADVDKVRALLDGIGVRIYGDVLTPSGGRHFYVAGHPDLPTVHAAEGSDGFESYPGTEVLSFGTNVFLPRTLRPKYDGAGYVVMLDELEVLADGGDPDSAEALVGWVAENRLRRAEAFSPSAPWSGAPPDARQTAYLEAVLKKTYERISVMGRDSGRNKAVFNAAMACGNYIAGAGMKQHEVTTMLEGAAQACGLTAEDGEESVRATIASGLKNGLQRPRAVPDATQAPVTALVDGLAGLPGSTSRSAPDRDGHRDDDLDVDHPDIKELEALDAAALFAREVALEAHKIRVREAARDKVAAEKAQEQPPFDAGTLAEVLTRPAEPPHRVADLVPSGASALLVAAKKTGKTTLTLNLARCLIEGGEFLGRFDTRPLTGRVGVLNYEVSGQMLAGWAADVGVPEDRFVMVNLRGRRNPLRVEEDRAKLADYLREMEVEALVVDPFGRAYGGKSQNDAAEVGAWLVDLDMFARTEAGASEVYLCAHAGWTAERTRGSSALEDWPDVTIKLTRDKDDEQLRYLAAEGRDVLVKEDRLDFDPKTRELTLAGTGSRRKARAAERNAELSAAVVEIVTHRPGIHTSALEAALREAGHGVQRGDAGNAARAAVSSGHLRSEHGARNSVLYYPRLAVVPSNPEPSQRNGLSSPDPSYRGRDYSTTTQSSSSPGSEGGAS